MRRLWVSLCGRSSDRLFCLSGLQVSLQHRIAQALLSRSPCLRMDFSDAFYGFDASISSESLSALVAKYREGMESEGY